MATTRQKLENDLEHVKTTKAEISRTKAGATRLLKSIQKISKQAEKLLSDAKEDIKSQSASVDKEIKNQAISLKASLGQERDDVEQIRKDAKKEYNKFKTTYRAATNKNDGMEIRYKKLVDLHSNASNLHNEISKNATAARNLTGAIQDAQKTAKSNEKNIADIHERARVVSQEVEDTYSIVLDTTLAGTFVSRKQEVAPRVRTWEFIYIGSFVSIAIALILALTVDRPDNFVEVLTDRVVFVTPLVAIAFVASRQFSHERKVLEEYAFKAAKAQSLRGYTLLLNDQFKDLPESRKKILDFTIGAMSDIYDRKPLGINPSNYHFRFGNQMAKIEAKIEEVVDEKISEAKASLASESDLLDSKNNPLL
jgi:hypothetical protein